MHDEVSGRAKPLAHSASGDRLPSVVVGERTGDYRGGGSPDIGPGASAMLSEVDEGGAGAAFGTSGSRRATGCSSVRTITASTFAAPSPLSAKVRRSSPACGTARTRRKFSQPDV